MGEVDISVGPQDVNGIEISLSTGVQVRGRIEHTGAPPVDPDDQSESGVLRLGSSARVNRYAPVQALILQPGRFPTTGTQPPANVDEQGNFTFTDMLPGRYALQGFGPSIVSIRSGNTDVLADGLEIGTSEPEPLVITMSDGGGRIAGTVSGLETGERATIAVVRAGGSVVATSTAMQNANANEARFVVFNLPAGDYTLYAWPATQQVEFRNREVLHSLSAGAVTVTVSENGQQQVTLKMMSIEN